MCCTSNLYHCSMRCPPLPPGGGEVVTLFRAVLPRVVVQYLPSCSFTLGELELVHWATWSGSRFIMFGAVCLRAVWAALYELFVHSERTRAATQGVYMLNLCNILCYSMSVEIYCYVSHAVRETACYNVSV